MDIFFTEGDFLEIFEETNRYACIQKASRQDIVSTRVKDWPEEGITLGDLKLFYSLTDAMGLVKQECIPSYWSTNAVLRTPFFGEVMPRDLFCLIFSCLHLSDNDDYVPQGQEGYEPLKKLRNFYPNLQERFLNAWSPGKIYRLMRGRFLSGASPISVFIIQ